MRILIAGLLLASIAFAEDHETKFTVQKIDVEKVTRLAKADANLTAALEVFQKAQTALAAAQSAKEKIAVEIKSSANLFEADCEYPRQPRNGGYLAPGPRKWRRAEIRGEYLLVSEGESTCPGWFTTLSTVTGSGDSIFVH